MAFENILENRRFMHCPSFKEGMAESDQSKGITAPAFDKPAIGELITLPSFEGVIKSDSYSNLLDVRRSKRNYKESAISQSELAFMLWSTQGIQSVRAEVATFRPVPSGGARHPFETYVVVKNVEGLNSGIYHYRPAENIGEKIVTIEKVGDLPNDEKIKEMLVGQSWALKSPIILFYSCIPYKAEWRYAHMAHRVMLIDLGHVGQNVMLSASALGLGSCCMAAFDQEVCDELLGVDGVDEYTVYAITVGEFKE